MTCIEFYREHFNFELPSHQIATCHAKFIRPNSESV